MTTPRTRLRQSKTSENTLQKMLWPGTPRRPWKERWDVAGLGRDGGIFYGEVKESRDTSLAKPPEPEETT